MVLTEQERVALNKKLENPESVVKCPRCGALIEIYNYPTAVRVSCKTEGCIQKTIRGI